jgi:hypothetical protein
VNPRRFLSLLALFALLAMPFGHRQAGAHSEPAAMAGHCHGGSVPSPGKADRAAIDCAVACAAIAPAAASPEEPFMPVAANPEAAVPAIFPGIRSATDPPPPRLG